MHCYSVDDTVQLVLEDKLIGVKQVIDSASQHNRAEWYIGLMIRWGDQFLGPLACIGEDGTRLLGKDYHSMDGTMVLYWEAMNP